ncbi:helix-turn-helix transcriptional regulator [Halomonas campisalis]|uniref:Helix-turn-helix transcriptional regulator n=1 Tax=Billgrantia campisalis TaxID=74661 RepID=A0ABS9P5E7_9GAMM|nr:AraC family transcriptional regulator [Halomonas campisalis]MCG6657017.1 helix-turn-helix transcriptional regulator [Halomonas campisalis]MDR5862202.1 AraC family transcriptional regulator [Halomonas campisalis]
MSNEMVQAEIWLQETLESQHSIDELATRLGYSTSQVRRRFRQRFGLSPGAYRDMLRLEMAARLLTLTPYSIAEIARQCGYHNHSAFSRAFHRHHGQTPRHYRQAQRQALRHQCHGGDPPAFEIRQQHTRRALVTRLYRASRRLHDLTHWARHANAATPLPSRLKHSPAVAIVHNLPLPGAVERIDIGPLVTEQTAPHIAIPSSFRLLELPARQHACLVLEDVEEIPRAVRTLIALGLPLHGRYASGEPAQLLSHPQGVEVQLPLLAEPLP